MCTLLQPLHCSYPYLSCSCMVVHRCIVLDRKFTWIKCKNVVKHNNNRPRGSRIWSSGTMGQVNGKSSALIHCNLSGLNYIPFLPRGYCMAPSPCGNSGNRGVHRILYVSFHLNCIGWQDLLSLCHCFLWLFYCVENPLPFCEITAPPLVVISSLPHSVWGRTFTISRLFNSTSAATEPDPNLVQCWNITLLHQLLLAGKGQECCPFAHCSTEQGRG